jgi:hypothetical protein
MAAAAAAVFVDSSRSYCSALNAKRYHVFHLSASRMTEVRMEKALAIVFTCFLRRIKSSSFEFWFWNLANRDSTLCMGVWNIEL